MTDRRTLEAAASALRRLPEKARAGHLARRLSEMAARVEAGERDVDDEGLTRGREERDG